MQSENLDIIYEDNHLLAVNKPPGIIVQPDYSNRDSLLFHVKNYLVKKYNKPGDAYAGLVHRLDRHVSGIIVFAKTSKAASRLFKEFGERSVVKIYLSLVNNDTDLENKWTMLNQWLIRNHNISKVVSYQQYGSQEASLEFKQVSRNKDYILLAVKLLTGRKHQIRAQLAHYGIPIIGDTLYGSKEFISEDQILLHSYYLRFKHPTRNEDISLIVPPPKTITDRIPVPLDIIKVID